MRNGIQVVIRREEFEKLAARANLQKQAIAKKINISEEHLSRALSGARQLSPGRRRKLQEVLGADFDALFLAMKRGVSSNTPRQSSGRQISQPGPRGRPRKRF